MKSQIKSGAVLSYVNMFINILVTAFYTPFMLRMMGQNEYGLYSLVNSVIAYLSVLDMGFGNAMIAKFELYPSFDLINSYSFIQGSCVGTNNIPIINK